jgi:hypothetical protein
MVLGWSVVACSAGCGNELLADVKLSYNCVLPRKRPC